MTEQQWSEDAIDPFKSLNKQNKIEREAFLNHGTVRDRTTMTRRDHFAMAAMAGMVAAGKNSKPIVVSEAVKYADLLIEELAKNGELKDGT